LPAERGTIAVVAGKAILPETLTAMDRETMLVHLRKVFQELKEQAEQLRRKG
jgi:hypothetical protein